MHDHAHATVGIRGAGSRRLLAISLGLTATVMIVQVVGAILSGSLALLADAAHMFTDSSALVIALIASAVAARPADDRRTFGYQRAEVFGALINAIIDLPFAISPIVVGLALLLTFGIRGWFGTWLVGQGFPVIFALPGIILATVFVTLPFVVREVIPVLEEVGDEQEQAASTLGASGWTTFWRITFPVLLPAIVAGALLAFTLSVDEFIIAFFTAGAGRSSITLPMQIYSMIRFGITPEVNALATIVMGVSATALMISQWLNKEQVR